MNVVMILLFLFSAAAQSVSTGTVEEQRQNEIEKKIVVRVKDPFMMPNHLYFMIKKNMNVVSGEGFVDESAAPQRRWALKYYHLIAVIWNVAKPKAMFSDKNDLQLMFFLGDEIGNGGGVITSIESGQVVVNEKGNKFVLKFGSRLK